MVFICLITASIEELRIIPGVGQKKVEAIVGHREQFGRVTKEALCLPLMGELPT